MDSQQMQRRTRQFALRVLKLVAKLPTDHAGNSIGRQIIKSGTSIGANYAEASGASSRKHFVSLIEIAAREARETLYWLDLMADAQIFRADQLGPLHKECDELLAILTAMGRTAKRRKE